MANCDQTNKRLPAVNVGESERLISMFGAGIFATCGMMRGSLSLLAIGAGLAYRGLTGHCHVYEAIGQDTASSSGALESQNSSTPRVIVSE